MLAARYLAILLSRVNLNLNSMPYCQCSICFPSKKKAIRTIKKHLKQDESLLCANDHAPEFIAHLQKCIDQNVSYLRSVDFPDDGEQNQCMAVKTEKQTILIQTELLSKVSKSYAKFTIITARY